MNTQEAVNAMVNGTPVVATTEYGKTYAGTIDGHWVIGEVGYKVKGLVHPTSSMAGNGPHVFTVRFYIGEGAAQSSINAPAESIRLV